LQLKIEQEARMAKAMLQIFAALLVFSAAAAGQTNAPAGAPADASPNDSAVYVTSDQIQDVAKQLSAVTKGTAFRIVDVGNAYVGVALQNRLKIAPGGRVPGPILHTNVTEVYYVLSGSATMATGGVMTDQKPRKAGSEEGTGPGFDGTVAKPNDVRKIKAGDVVIIPKNMAHWFSEVPEDITYLVVRIDPEKSIGLK
jgi:mannose-6-phosphate isomerase-like protein (cupin superfamily)